MRVLLFILMVFVYQTGVSQSANIGDLYHQLSSASKAKEKFNILEQMYQYYSNTPHLDSIGITTSQMMDIARKERDDSLLVRANIAVNGFYWCIGNYPLSIEYSFKAINLAAKMGDIRTCARTYSNTA